MHIIIVSIIKEGVFFLVEFKDVSVTYSSGVDALNRINLKINDGDFAFVVGPSGAGKSTLIKLVLKEIDASSGGGVVNGFNLRKMRRGKGEQAAEQVAPSQYPTPKSPIPIKLIIFSFKYFGK